jgi:uncharacterized protein YbjT (DUF2867 family)
MKKPLILVTGATGFVGREAVAQLVDAHHPVRALVRDPAKAKSLGEAVEVIVGDLAKPDTFTPAFAGVQKTYVIANGPDFPALEANAYQAARQAEAKHIVKLSGRGVGWPDIGKTVFGRQHETSEERRCS